MNLFMSPRTNRFFYREFVSNLIVSYYELLLAPFIDKKERQAEKITVAFETPDEIQRLLNELSELELHPKKDLLSLYEQLAVKYEASNTSKEEFQKEVNLRKIMPLLSFELEDLAKECQEYQGLLADLSNSHHVRDDLVNQETMCVYKVKNEAQAMVFNPKGKATCLLGHGTNDQNLLSILEDGIEANPKYIASGSSLGKGAYFAQLTDLLNTLENICLLRKWR